MKGVLYVYFKIFPIQLIFFFRLYSKEVQETGKDSLLVSSKVGSGQVTACFL